MRGNPNLPNPDFTLSCKPSLLLLTFHRSSNDEKEEDIERKRAMEKMCLQIVFTVNFYYSHLFGLVWFSFAFVYFVVVGRYVTGCATYISKK